MRRQNRCQMIELSSNPKAFFWIIDLQEINESEVEEAKAFLDMDSIERSKRFVYQQDQYRYLITYSYLKEQLGILLQQEPSGISLSRNQYGKPYLENNEIHFNLSHTKKKAFIGVHFSYPIGVDIEEDAEYRRANDSSIGSMEDLEMSLRSWCAEEAYLKAIGTGFTSKRPELEYLSSVNEVDLFKANGIEIHVYNSLIQNFKLAVCILEKTGENH